MRGVYAKRAVLILTLLILVVEGYFAYRWYDRYQVPDTASGVAHSSAPASGETMPEGMAPEETTAAGEALSNATVEGAFVHRATGGNSRGDYTYLSNPSIDGDPNAVILATPALNRGSAGDGPYDHNVGVWYEFEDKKKWAIFNQDLAAVPAGAAFEVVVPPASERFVHRAGLLNTVGNATYLDNPLTNGEPDAALSITQNWNPGGGGGVDNDHPVGVLYDEDAGQWLVYNNDDARMPDGAAFNIAVSGAAELAR